MGSPDSCVPAPYGQACAGCSRAKSKCFYRYEGSGCERCHRLGKSCEPSTTRKRKARTQLPPLAPPTRLEEKLDDLVSLLRSQAVQKQSQAPEIPPEATPEGSSILLTSSNNPVSSTARDPDVVLDTTTSAVRLVRPASSSISLSPIPGDVSVHEIVADMAEEQLSTFRRDFLSMFPFMHIPDSMRASDLRLQKPFLWLVVMCLTSKIVSRQFAMEATIWRIITQRVVSEHLADMDLLLGIVCFASWSHYFKKDKPFMCMLTQVAVSLAFDLGLHKDNHVSSSDPRRSNSSNWQPMGRRSRTMEERRTLLAVFHLTSSTWTAYRKTEPLRWTAYMDSCLRILSEGQEIHLDILLATQVKCHIITNSLDFFAAGEFDENENAKAPSAVLITAMLQQLGEIRQSLPDQIRSQMNTLFYLYSTEIIIRESLVKRPRSHDQTGLSNFRRLQDLDSVLTSVQRWLAVFSEMTLLDWTSITVDWFAQFTHCLVVLFKLTILAEPGWDTKEVRKRADVFNVLDRSCDTIDRVPAAVGMADADGPRRGLFYKTTYLLRAIKTLFLAEMAPEALPGDLPTPKSSVWSYGSTVTAVDAGTSDDFDAFLASLSDEPWLSDILGSSWDP